jgi:hypothetical protein
MQGQIKISWVLHPSSAADVAAALRHTINIKHTLLVQTTEAPQSQ